VQAPPRTSIPVPADYLQSRGEGLILKTPEPGQTGRFLVIDLGREEVGWLTFTLDAPAGTILDVAHGEHLDDGRVRAAIGNRNFADRYICCDGAQEFTLPFRRLGARYIEVHLSNYGRPIRLNYVGLRPAVLPVKFAGAFTCSDSLAESVFAIGVRTLHLCMHEHYEDCPWREQALYARAQGPASRSPVASRMPCHEGALQRRGGRPQVTEACCGRTDGLS
jgi:alpha-L-rhamnosidase